MWFGYVSDSVGRLTQKPQNVLVVGNHDAQLNCSTDGVTGGQLAWTYDHDHIIWPPCVSQHPKSFIATSPRNATDCHIRAASSAYGGISGAYICYDRTERAVAVVIVIGSILLSYFVQRANNYNVF